MELITKADFARRAGVSRQMVGKMCKPDGRLYDSISAGKIDIDSQPVRDYSNDKNVDLSNPRIDARRTPVPPPHETSMPSADTPVENFEAMTLVELCDVFGTDERFKQWLIGRKAIVSIKSSELKIDEARGRLISRKLVEVGVIDTFNSAHLRLLKDGAKSIAAGVVSKHSAGAELSEIEAFVSDVLGSFIRPIKGKVVRVLKNV